LMPPAGATAPAAGGGMPSRCGGRVRSASPVEQADDQEDQEEDDADDEDELADACGHSRGAAGAQDVQDDRDDEQYDADSDERLHVVLRWFEMELTGAGSSRPAAGLGLCMNPGRRKRHNSLPRLPLRP